MIANVLSCALFISLTVVSIQAVPKPSGLRKYLMKGAPQIECCNLEDFCQRPLCRAPIGYSQEPTFYRLISTSAPAPSPAPRKSSKECCADPCSYCCACKVRSACMPTACYVPHICIKPKITVQPRFACHKPICSGDCCILDNAKPCPPDCPCGCCSRI